MYFTTSLFQLQPAIWCLYPYKLVSLVSCFHSLPLPSTSTDCNIRFLRDQPSTKSFSRLPPGTVDFQGCTSRRQPCTAISPLHSFSFPTQPQADLQMIIPVCPARNRSNSRPQNLLYARILLTMILHLLQPSPRAPTTPVCPLLYAFITANTSLPTRLPRSIQKQKPQIAPYETNNTITPAGSDSTPFWRSSYGTLQQM